MRSGGNCEEKGISVSAVTERECVKEIKGMIKRDERVTCQDGVSWEMGSRSGRAEMRGRRALQPRSSAHNPNGHQGSRMKLQEMYLVRKWRVIISYIVIGWSILVMVGNCVSG